MFAFGAIAASYGSSVIKESRRNIKDKAEEEQLEKKEAEERCSRVASGKHLGKQHWLGGVSFNHGKDWIPFVCGAVHVSGIHGVIRESW